MNLNIHYNELKGIPQIKDYCQITNPRYFIMNILRGMFSKPRINNSNFPTRTCVQNNVLTNLDDGKNFSKNIFYACPFCEGSLIPEAQCTICKRTSIRKCVKCSHVCETLNHESCKLLMSLGREIAQKHQSVLVR